MLSVNKSCWTSIDALAANCTTFTGVFGISCWATAANGDIDTSQTNQIFGKVFNVKPRKNEKAKNSGFGQPNCQGAEVSLITPKVGTARLQPVVVGVVGAFPPVPSTTSDRSRDACRRFLRFANLTLDTIEALSAILRGVDPAPDAQLEHRRQARTQRSNPCSAPAAQRRWRKDRTLRATNLNS